jgi:hypothetical protein
MLKQTESAMSQVQVGDIVKSLDFNGIDDCYMLGRVVSVSKEFGDFRAQFFERVWQGKVDRKFKTDYFTAPLQGNLFTDRADAPRVVVVA